MSDIPPDEVARRYGKIAPPPDVPLWQVWRRKAGQWSAWETVGEEQVDKTSAFQFISTSELQGHADFGFTYTVLPSGQVPAQSWGDRMTRGLNR